MSEHPNVAIVRSGLLGRVVAETGIEVKDLSIQEIFADEGHAVVLLESTLTRGDRNHTGEYVDIYGLRDGKATEHRHLAVDPRAEEKFFGSSPARSWPETRTGRSTARKER